MGFIPYFSTIVKCMEQLPLIPPLQVPLQPDLQVEEELKLKLLDVAAIGFEPITDRL